MNELVKFVEDSGVAEETAKTLKDSFVPLLDQAEEWKAKALSLVVTDESQKEEMAQAREARLVLRDIRIAADKKRVELKQESILYGKAVQGMYDIIKFVVVPPEKHLQKQEDFVKIQEEKRREKLKEDRLSELEPYSQFIPHGLDWGTMDEEDYHNIIGGAKLRKKDEEDAIKKAEEIRLAEEKRKVGEQEKIRKENEKLKKEREVLEVQRKKEKAAAKRDEARRKKEQEIENKKREEEAKKGEAKRKADQAAAEKMWEKNREVIEKERKKVAEAQAKVKADRKKEKEAADKKLEAERKKRLEIERKAKAEAHRQAEANKAEEDAMKKAAAAPDKDKLKTLSGALKNMDMPDMQTDEGKEVIVNVKTLLAKVEGYIIKELSTF